MDEPNSSAEDEPGGQQPGARRVLLTGLATYWGGKLAQTLEADESIEAIVGVDSEEPTRELGRTEFVRVGNQHALIERIITAARIDTVIDTRLVVDSTARGRAGRARRCRRAACRGARSRRWGR